MNLKELIYKIYIDSGYNEVFVFIDDDSYADFFIVNVRYKKILFIIYEDCHFIGKNETEKNIECTIKNFIKRNKEKQK